MEILVWCLAILLILIGLIGSAVPLLPGTTLILLAALLQKWLLSASLTWFAVGWIAAFWLISVLADFGCTMLGTKLFGGGKWGMAGATGGALAGMFFSLPALIFGTVFGAIAAEKIFGKRSDEQALKAGAGAAVGFLLSTVARLACALVMVGIYVIAVLYLRPGGAVTS
ncbi:MAG TPA: DUF456 domain-containing protein [Candidatus Didemnitutus sp.]|nr:DUF456 domain-containing protein [Candidatus Didemnitutus sp.]